MYCVYPKASRLRWNFKWLCFLITFHSQKCLIKVAKKSLHQLHQGQILMNKSKEHTEDPAHASNIVFLQVVAD